MEVKVTEVKAIQYHCVRCGNVWTGRKNDHTPKYCSSCRKPWDRQAKFRVARKEGNSHYISNREKAHKQNVRLYSLDKDDARRTSIIRDMTAIPANLRKSTSCLNIYSGRPDYPVYNKEENNK